MVIIDLFSKRQKVLRNEVPDVYQYDPHTHSTEGSDYPTRAAVGNLGSLIGSHPLSSQARQIFGSVRPRTGGSRRWDYLLTLSHNKHFLGFRFRRPRVLDSRVGAEKDSDEQENQKSSERGRDPKRLPVSGYHASAGVSEIVNRSSGNQ